MELRRLGNSDVLVSEVSLGCWTMGGPNWTDGEANGWGGVDEDEIVKAIKAAVDQGVNHFDTADIYGNGESERRIARALKSLGLGSDRFVIATKVGHVIGTAAHAYEPAHIRHQCEQSMINLKRDFIDIYYFHRGHFGEQDEYLEGAVQTMTELVEEGKVRLIGQSAYSERDFTRLLPIVRPTVLQSWASILDAQFVRPNSTVSTLMADGNTSFVAFSPLGQGLLLNKYDPDNMPTFQKGDHRGGNDQFDEDHIRALRPRLNSLTKRFGCSGELAWVALRYVLNHAHVACVIPGFRNANQVMLNVGASGYHLSKQDMEFIDALFRDWEPLS